MSVVLRRRPEWKAAVVVACAWALVLAGQGHAAHAGHAAAGDPGIAVLRALPAWALMSVAMMGPVTLRAVRYVARNSFRTRRDRAVALYLAAYVGVWVALGVVLLTLAQAARELAGLPDRTLVAATLVLAAGWQLTRSKRRALLACGRTVALPPVGLRSDLACMRFAWLEGTRCVRSCWPLMAVMAVAGAASALLMPALAALVALEELTVTGRRLVRPLAAVLAAAALAVAVGA